MPIYCQHLSSSDRTEFLHGPSLIKGSSWIMSVRGRKLNGVDGEIVSCKDVAYSGKGDWHSALWCRFYFGVFVCLPVPTKVRKHSSVAESLLPSLFALHDRPLRCIAWSPAPWIGCGVRILVLAPCCSCATSMDLEGNVPSLQPIRLASLRLRVCRGLSFWKI